MNDRRDIDWGSAPVFGTRPDETTCVIRPSAYALVADEGGRVAVVRSRDGIFLPGGGIEAGETPEDAIQREALEECGLVLELGIAATRAVQFSYSASERTWFEKRSTFIDAAVAGTDPSRLEPGHELMWVDVETATRILSHESHARAVERWRNAESGSGS
jgi:8-oxo-dGTP diphosphatase